MTWSDREDIAEALMEAHPGVDPLTVRFTDLRNWIAELDDFEDDIHTSNEAKLESILSRQTPDADKRRRAHFVIDTGGSLEMTRAIVAQFMRSTAALAGGRSRHA